MSTPISAEQKEFYKGQYKLAIDARDKLNDNYHKWMTYYYVANAAILVAITSLYSKDTSNPALLLLPLIGLLASMLWNLSCKGYYYWSTSWIQIIIRYERLIMENDTDNGVYSIFSKNIVNADHSFLKPNTSANISTPKLTLIFSQFTMLLWSIFSVWQFWVMNDNETNLHKSIIVAVISIIFVFLYIGIFPTYAQSLGKGTHTLVECLPPNAGKSARFFKRLIINLRLNLGFEVKNVDRL